MLAANVQRAAEREKHTQRVRHGYAAYRIREFVRHVHEAWLDKARRKVMYATQPYLMHTSCPIVTHHHMHLTCVVRSLSRWRLRPSMSRRLMDRWRERAHNHNSANIFSPTGGASLGLRCD